MACGLCRRPADSFERGGVVPGVCRRPAGPPQELGQQHGASPFKRACPLACTVSRPAYRRPDPALAAAGSLPPPATSASSERSKMDTAGPAADPDYTFKVRAGRRCDAAALRHAAGLSLRQRRRHRRCLPAACSTTAHLVMRPPARCRSCWWETAAWARAACCCDLPPADSRRCAAAGGGAGRAARCFAGGLLRACVRPITAHAGSSLSPCAAADAHHRRGLQSKDGADWRQDGGARARGRGREGVGFVAVLCRACCGVLVRAAARSPCSPAQLMLRPGALHAAARSSPLHPALPQKLTIWDTAGQERFRTLTSCEPASRLWLEGSGSACHGAESSGSAVQCSRPSSLARAGPAHCPTAIGPSLRLLPIPSRLQRITAARRAWCWSTT